MKILLKKTTIFCLVFALIINLANAISIGVSPGKISMQDMLKGGYAEKTITISTNSEEDLVAHFEVGGEIEKWLRFEPNSTVITLSKTNPYKLKIIAEPPNDVRNDSYSGSIIFITDRFGDISGRAGGIVKAAVTFILDTRVINEEISKCSAGAFNFKDVEIGYPLELSMSVANQGNIRIKPTVTIDVWDMMKDKIVMSRELIIDEVLPTTERAIFAAIQNQLDAGQYWADIAIDECSARNLITFSVFEKGGIADRGELAYITNKAWAITGETVPITAMFNNVGGRIAFAKFLGDIRLEDKVVKVIDTEEAQVPFGESRTFDYYFTPTEPGRYTITGRISYNKKITFEKSSILNVNPSEAPITEEGSMQKILPLLIYLIIITTILFIVRKIIKEKKKRRF